MNKEIWEFLYDLRILLSEMCNVIYNLALTDSNDDTELSNKIWDIKDEIMRLGDKK